MTSKWSIPRTRPSSPREPLWTVKEFALEFGIDYRKLATLIARKNDGCPKPVFRHHSISQNESYYPVRAMRKWWATVKDHA